MLGYLSLPLNQVLVGILIPTFARAPIADGVPRLKDFGYYEIDVPEKVFNANLREYPIVSDFDLNEAGDGYTFNNERYSARIAEANKKSEEEIL